LRLLAAPVAGLLAVSIALIVGMSASAGPVSHAAQQVVSVDHYKCYNVQPQFQRTHHVSLQDQFGTTQAVVLKAKALCTPVSKDNGQVLQPGTHLVCYELRPATGFTARTVEILNQFGDFPNITLMQAERLCVPSLKLLLGTVARKSGARVAQHGKSHSRRHGQRQGKRPTGTIAPAVDHYQCYKVTPRPFSKIVTLKDQFVTTTSTVSQLVRVCAPVSKNNEGIHQPQYHLACYLIHEPIHRATVVVSNQFGVERMTVTGPDQLCVPSFKVLCPPGCKTTGTSTTTTTGGTSGITTSSSGCANPPCNTTGTSTGTTTGTTSLQCQGALSYPNTSDHTFLQYANSCNKNITRFRDKLNGGVNIVQHSDPNGFTCTPVSDGTYTDIIDCSGSLATGSTASGVVKTNPAVSQGAGGTKDADAGSGLQMNVGTLMGP
jgi:hypothetical protein